MDKEKLRRIGIIIILLLLMGAIIFEVSFIYKKHHKNNSNNSNSTVYKNQVVDIYTGYKENGLEIVKKEKGNITYYLIDGLKNKELENKINSKIEEHANKCSSTYNVNSNEITANFENILSIYFNDCGDKKDPININLIDGKDLTLMDIVNDKEKLKLALSKSAEEYILRFNNIEELASRITISEEVLKKYDKSKNAESVKNIEKEFDNGNYTFYFYDGYMVFNFTNVEYYSQELVYQNENDSKSFDIKIEKNNKDIELNVKFTNLVDNLIIYDKYKTTDSLYESAMKEVNYKFTKLPANKVVGQTNTAYILENDDSIYSIYSIYPPYYGEKKELTKLLMYDISKIKNNEKYNVYKIIGVSGPSFFNNEYSYYGFRVKHYSIDKHIYEKYRKQIYLDRYDVYEREIINKTLTYGFSYLKDYEDRDQYHYYILDKNGKEIDYTTIFNMNFNWSSYIPESWVQESNYNSIEEMVKDAEVIYNGEDYIYKIPNHLVISIQVKYDHLEYKFVFDGKMVEGPLVMIGNSDIKIFN